MMKAYRYRPAFTLLEVIFVIVILGIVASLGSELIVKVYQQYIVQRAQHRASIKTELAATLIANRLASAIPGTVVRRTALTGGTIEGINDDMNETGDSYIALQWVGADMDSFNATAKPGWSGFCDVDDSNKTRISTPGSALSTTTSVIIDKLSGGSLPTSSPALFFPYDLNAYPATLSMNENITLAGGASHIVEHYKLAWSSYAVTIENGDLYLHYGFTPQPGIDIPDEPKSLLMKNISTFKFKGAGRTIRFKICKEENIGEDYNITACKEKAVF